MADEEKLDKAVQLFIVEELARFRSPKQIIEAVKELFDKTLTKQQIYYYSQLCAKKLKSKPTKATTELQNYFEECRTKFKKKIEDIGGFHQPYRLQILQEELEIELEKKFPLRRTPIILDIVEQMAKEAGGMFTNKRELTGANGQPLIPIEQMAAILFQRLKDKGFSEEKAAEFASSHFQIPKEKIK